MTNLSNTQSQVLPHEHEISEINGLGTSLSGKQDKLVAGSNISIAADGKTISATDTKYTAGTNVQIDANNKISATDTKYSAATQSAAGLMSAADKTKLDGIAEGAGVQLLTGVKGDAESSYRTGNVNITKSNIGLGNVDNTSDANKPVSTATQSALDLKQNIADMPTDLGDFTNNAGFIKNTVNNLTNYYKKAETYTKTEIDTLISNFGGFEVVSTLPTSNIKTNVIYLLGPIGTGADKYEEWIYYSSTWTKIGETSVDLTNYFNKTSNTSDNITQGSNNLFVSSTEKSTWNGKQNALATQTAYTSKGTANKVPQITTNSLGQVTGITEVSISYPSQVSDTAYASSWNGVTSTAPSKNAVYDKISAMDTTISGKQNALSAQTAYTSKGTATKVPTITTNTLGQVTGITETNISFPVTSVNGKTGAVSLYSSIQVTLTSSGWSSNTQTVTATGVTASNNVVISPAPSSFADYTSAVIYCSAQASNSLTFTCTDTPTSNLTVNVLIMN